MLSKIKNIITITAVLIATFSITLSVFSSAQAVPVLDQSFNGGSNVSYGVSDHVFHSQVFTSGLSGKLTSIELYLGSHTLLAGTLNVNILDTIAGTPGNNILGTASILSTSILDGQNYYTFDFSSFDIFVDVGDVLAIGAGGLIDSFFVLYAASNPLFPGASVTYDGGDGFIKNNISAAGTWVSVQRDYLFRTYVDTEALPLNAVPIPAALPLFGTGLAIMGLMGWRRKRKAS